MATATLPLDLGGHGLDPEREVHRNLSVPELVEHAVRLDEGILVASGALRATTGERTGRSPDAKRVAKDPAFEDTIWWGAVNKPVDPEAFDRFHEKVAAYLSERPLYVFDGYAGADPEHRIGVRVVNERAWHNLFAHQLFLRPTAAELEDHAADFTILHAPGLQADPADGSGDTAAVFLSFEKRLILIAGTEYAGEMKKSIFTVMNGLMPRQGVLPMHCSANVGPDGDVVLFFGLSGTGKTTLSADPERRLIGDDEHGWSGSGVFNFEGGCYAKTIKLSAENEPQIWAAIRFGSVLENVAVDDERAIDYDDASITENTRAGYPVDYIPNAMIPGVGGHPKTIVFLTADAFGVLPPIARLSREQAMYHFVSGYTAKVAGTEKGVTEPKATFSACFGAPFLPLHPTTYAEMLGDRIDRVGATVWLVNTGWTGGPYGTGHRMDLPSTRAMVRAALSGELSRASFRTDPIFGFEVPESVPDVDSAILDPRSTWSDGAAYDEKARDLARRFRENYEKYDEGGKAAGGPTV